MRGLAYLFVRKNLGMIRNQFRTVTSALFMVFILLVYGGLVAACLAMAKTDYLAETMAVGTNLALLAGIGMLALLAVSTLVSKRKALVYDTDAFYLYSGPYSRSQINGYVLMQTLLQGLFLGLLGTFMSAMLSMTSYFPLRFLLFSIVVYWLLMTFFLLVNDYIYMWSLVDPKYRIWTYVVPVLLLAAAGLVFLLSCMDTDFKLKEGFLAFAQGEQFYYIPFFGWAKWAMNSFIEGNPAGAFLGILLLLVFDIAAAAAFLRFDKDIAEQAAADAQEVTAYLRNVKEHGTQPVELKKVKRVKADFREGAGAVFSKNLLLMKKTGNFLRGQDVFLIVLYFLISLFVLPSNTFYMFCYMMIFWMLNLLNDSDMMRDLKNYQIYLIPDSPFKKLVCVVLPTFLKVSVVAGAAVVFAGVFTKMPAGEILNWLVMILGYVMILISGTVLSVRLLGSRTNAYAENLLRMVIVAAAAVPSVLAGILLFFLCRNLALVMALISAATLIMNLAVTVLILICCQGMMNGKEL